MIAHRRQSHVSAPEDGDGDGCETIGFAISDEDRERLNRLVEHFGGGNRSELLRATLKVMESLRRAELLRELQTSNHRRLAERGISADELPDLMREAYKGSGD